MPEPKIIYETENFLAVVKPAGLVVHGTRDGGGGMREEGKEEGKEKEPTLVDWLVKRRPEVKGVGDDPELRPGIVHRLDKDTSGVMLVAKNQNCFSYLKLLFQKHEIKKTYYAIVSGVPKHKAGMIDAPIGIRSGTVKRSVRSAKMQKIAITEYRVLKTFNPTSHISRPTSLLEVRPQTGRTHQIRVHLASIGHPIVGDKLYGPKSKTPYPLLMLHAAALEFREKDGSIVHIESESPF